MDGMRERIIEEWVCLHKQITERVGCPHTPRHDLAEAVIHGLGTRDSVTQRAIRAAAQRRQGWPDSVKRGGT